MQVKLDPIGMIDELVRRIESLTGPLLAEDQQQLLALCEWRQVNQGQLLHRIGEPCRQWMLVLQGELCGFRGAVAEPEQADFYRLSGDSIGHGPLLADGRYQVNLIAATSVRLAVFPVQIFERLWQGYQCFQQQLIKQLASFDAQGEPRQLSDPKLVLYCQSAGIEQIAVAESLANAGQIETLITFAVLREQLNIAPETGQDAEHPDWQRVYDWWAELGEQTMILLADDQEPAWAQFCAGCCHRLVVMVDANESPIEPLALDFAPRFGCQRWLLLCHGPETVLPKGTRRWLRALSQPKHLHLRLNTQTDYQRVMRTLQGQAVGVVFGGGHARCFAQLGVVQAMKEANMPVDMIGGTSFGALLAAHVALENDLAQIKAANEVLRELKPFKALRWPGLSLLKEERFNSLAQRVFADLDIEDFWLPYFCISTNLTTGDEVVIQSGLMRDAARATGSVPVLIPPARQGKDMLVDGGLVNNLPVDVMRAKTRGTIVAIDVGISSPLHFSDQQQDDWFNRWFNWGNEQGISIFTIADRSMSLINHRKSQHLDDDKLLLLPLPLPAIKMTQFEAMDQLVELGYQQSKPLLKHHRW